MNKAPLYRRVPRLSPWSLQSAPLVFDDLGVRHLLQTLFAIKIHVIKLDDDLDLKRERGILGPPPTPTRF